MIVQLHWPFSPGGKSLQENLLVYKNPWIFHRCGRNSHKDPIFRRPFPKTSLAKFNTLIQSGILDGISLPEFNCLSKKKEKLIFFFLFFCIFKNGSGNFSGTSFPLQRARIRDPVSSSILRSRKWASHKEFGPFNSFPSRLRTEGLCVLRTSSSILTFRTILLTRRSNYLKPCSVRLSGKLTAN